VPVDLWAWWRGWSLVDPPYLALSLLWWPVDGMARLMALSLLMDPAPARAWRRYPALLSTEVRVGLWSTCLFLAGLLPAIFLMSLKGFQDKSWLAAELLLAGLGLLPGVYYLLYRSLAPLLVLRGAGAADALSTSARQIHGHLGPFLRAALPWLWAGWALEGLGWLAPDPWGLALAPLATALEFNALVRGASAL